MNQKCILYYRTMYVLADVMDDQLKSMWFSPFQAEEIETDLDMVKGFEFNTQAKNSEHTLLAAYVEGHRLVRTMSDAAIRN